MYYSPELVVLSLPNLLLFIYVIFINQTKSKSKEKEAPELRSDWPIIGHLHLLGGGDKLLYRILGSMAAKYGPAFNIRLGAHRSLVVSSWEVAKECFTVNDLALASRPKTAAVKHMCYNYAMFGMGPYTPYWREMRKIVTLELLSNRRLEMLKHIRSTEITCGINELYGRWKENSHQPVVVELNKWLEHIMLNIIMMMVAGKRYFGVASGGDEPAKCHEAIIDFFRLCGLFVVSDAIPSLGWLDLQGYEKQMKKTGKDFDLVLGGWLEEHRQKRKLCLERNKLVDAKDFIDVMLSLEDEKQLPNIEHDSDTIIKSTCLSMILGGSDTTAVTLTWAISLLLNHPDVLKKLQQELDDHVGKER
ncbi:putative cytochrome P450 [Helianthus annuus]|nr:putative cytochrome P450 [Helianthus annuus]KAJ0804932.1 putative cytochrome P450 [Helianthus annuus]KAJ0939299.1 putative cytochrome P450 [Helianthus annuus]